jgi:hypothetical protein
MVFVLTMGLWLMVGWGTCFVVCFWRTGERLFSWSRCSISFD